MLSYVLMTERVLVQSGNKQSHVATFFKDFKYGLKHGYIRALDNKKV